MKARFGRIVTCVAIFSAGSACSTGTVGPSATTNTTSTGETVVSAAGSFGSATRTSTPDQTAPSPTTLNLRTTSTVAVVPIGPGTFAQTGEALRRRVNSAGLSGGVVLVVRDGEIVHETAVGGVGRSTSLSTASSAKWLTAATMMAFVDKGVASLDDPVSRWLPEFEDAQPAVTVRQLLDHTSGVRDQACLWSGGSLADCVRRIAASPREFAPGSAFSYGNADYHVIGRVIEELGGSDFSTVFRQRIGDRLSMSSTTWAGAPTNPSPAAGLRTTVDDYARFLSMILGRGEYGGLRILSSQSIDELVRNQVGAYDTSRDYSVGITHIPRYSLGAWPDELDERGATVVVSGNGGKGFYPWVDFSTNSYGVVGVQDDRGAELAVPASQQVAAESWRALRP